MRKVIVEVCRAFALTVSAKKTDAMRMPPPRTPRTTMPVRATGKISKQLQFSPYLGGAVTETPDMSVEIARWTSASWMRIRWYLRGLYDQPKMALSLKTRIVKAEEIEALLYGCGTWTLYQKSTTPNSAPYTTGFCFGLSGHSTRDQTIGWPLTTVPLR